MGNNFPPTTRNQTFVVMLTVLASAGYNGFWGKLTEVNGNLALATAMSSVGIEAEAGGTAMTQTFTRIEKDWLVVPKGNEKIARFARAACQ